MAEKTKKTGKDSSKDEILKGRFTGRGSDLVFDDDPRYETIGDGKKAPKEPDLDDAAFEDEADDELDADEAGDEPKSEGRRFQGSPLSEGRRFRRS